MFEGIWWSYKPWQLQEFFLLGNHWVYLLKCTIWGGALEKRIGITNENEQFLISLSLVVTSLGPMMGNCQHELGSPLPTQNLVCGNNYLVTEAVQEICIKFNWVLISLIFLLKKRGRNIRSITFNTFQDILTESSICKHFSVLVLIVCFWL